MRASATSLDDLRPELQTIKITLTGPPRQHLYVKIQRHVKLTIAITLSVFVFTGVD